MRELSNAAAATAKGFEPLRAEANGFLVHHLNHSVTLPVGFEPTRGDSIGLAGRRLNRSATVSLAIGRRN